MTVNHDAVAALPITGSASKTLVRNVFVARMPYVLADSEDSRNLIAIDPSTGAKIVDLLLLGRVFHYDPTDTTTAHDGTTCLVSSDGLRYKLAVGTDVFAYAVLDNTIATPPVSPALGDSYLVAAGATGAWAGKTNFIAVKTSRGWEFVNFSIGRFVYVESVDTYYHKNAGGSWVTGFGNQVTSANSVPLSAAINFGKLLIIENQTTTAPPGSPTVGTAYIIGPSATGAWAGLDGKIAICEVAGSFVIYAPTNGWSAYDKAQNNSFTYNGSAWVTSASAIIKHKSIQSAGPTTPNTGGSGTTYYAFSSTTPPTNETQYSDPTGISYAASRAGAALEISYQATLTFVTAGAYVTALGRDAVINSIDWNLTQFAGSSSILTINLTFLTTAIDTALHTYNIRFYVPGLGFSVTNLQKRTLRIEEIAP